MVIFRGSKHSESSFVYRSTLITFRPVESLFEVSVQVLIDGCSVFADHCSIWPIDHLAHGMIYRGLPVEGYHARLLGHLLLASDYYDPTREASDR